MPYLISLAVLGAIIYAYYQYTTAPREWLKTLCRRHKFGRNAP